VQRLKIISPSQAFTQTETVFSAGIPSEDSSKLGPLIWQSNPDLFRFFYGRHKSLLKKVLTTEWTSELGFFSHRNFSIASQNDRPIGLLNCFAGRMMGDLYQSHLQLIPLVLASEAGPRLVRGLVAMGWLFPFVPRDALYVFNLSVIHKARNSGVGAKLMGIAEEKARSESLKSIHLDIPSGSPAIKFYQRLGYQALVETRLCQMREDENVPSHLRMVKTLPDCVKLDASLN
jgi:ribosomal protein S18 acetylase RimI-like enzyme